MDIKACAAVREAVGPDIDLMIDGYHWYSRAEALWIGKELEKLNFAWFEEPMEEDSMSSLCVAGGKPVDSHRRAGELRRQAPHARRMGESRGLRHSARRR